MRTWTNGCSSLTSPFRSFWITGAKRRNSRVKDYDETLHLLHCQLTYALFWDVFRVNVIGCISRPPVDNISLHSSLWSRPFKCDVVRIHKWYDIRYRIRSHRLVHLLGIWTLNAITCSVYLYRVLLSWRHISYICLRRVDRRQPNPLLVAFSSVPNWVLSKNWAFRWWPVNQHWVARHFLNRHVSWRVWIYK